jgi:hypothetical protein
LATANSDLDLVQYILSNGQPINSVLDSALPLHGVLSGGSDFVMLIEHEVDVIATR